MRSASAVHGANAANEADTKNQPRVRSHQPVAPSVHVQCARCKTDNTNAESSVHECVVQVAPLEIGHAAILAGFPVEDEVDAKQSGAKDAGAIDESLPQVTLSHWIVGGLLIRASEGSAEAEGIVCGGNRGRLGSEEVGMLLQRRIVERAGENGL